MFNYIRISLAVRGTDLEAKDRNGNKNVVGSSYMHIIIIMTTCVMCVQCYILLVILVHAKCSFMFMHICICMCVMDMYMYTCMFSHDIVHMHACNKHNVH